MLLSDSIEILKRFKEKYGDIEIVYYDKYWNVWSVMESDKFVYYFPDEENKLENPVISIE
jgi:hypothetical protein